MKRYIALIAGLICICSATNAQLNQNYFGFGVNYSLLTFKGDLNQTSKNNKFNNFRGGFDVNVEKRLNNLFGANVNFLYGKLSQQDFKNNTGLNFETKVTGATIQGIFFFDNDVILKRDITFSPYIKAGLGFISFNPYADLKDAEGKTYYFWEDGNIMDVAETDENVSNAQHLKRDFTFETQLASAQKTLTFPVSIGVTAILSPNLGFRIESGYNFTTSDKIDNIVSGGNDKFVHSKIGIIYAFNRSNKGDEGHHIDFNFDVFHKHDTDGDGIADFHDHCPNTPEGVAVNKKGCPLDDDGDGVPNHLDKEPETSAGAHVDEFGVTISEIDFLNQHLQKDSSLVMNRIHQLNEAPSIETLGAIDKEILESKEKGAVFEIPEHLKVADTNNDNIIQSEEMLHAIDAFLDGELDITITTLHQLIDFFFDQ